MNEKQIQERQDILIKSLHGCEEARTAIRSWLTQMPEELRIQLILECKNIVVEEKSKFPDGSPFFELLRHVKAQNMRGVAHFFINEFGLMELHTVLNSLMSD